MKKSNLYRIYTQLKAKFCEKLNARIQFTAQKEMICKKFGDKCNLCKCCIKKGKYELDHVRTLGNGGTNEPKKLQLLTF